MQIDIFLQHFSIIASMNIDHNLCYSNSSVGLDQMG